jgi:cytochrome c553
MVPAYYTPLLWVAVLVFVLPLAAAAAEPKPEDVEFFEKNVRPVLATRCFKCHGPTKQEAGLRVDSRARLLEGGDSGPAIVPGKPAEGFLIGAINYGELFQMPPDGKLKPEEIAAITQWVKIGAPWPGDAAVAGPKYEFNLKERAKHWAYQPIRSSTPPAVKQNAWPRDAGGSPAGQVANLSHVSGEIDRFILAKLEAAGLQPAAEADRYTWVRRVYFALIGLPPEPAEVRAFVADTSADAYEKVVDRLLKSPHFGERWARHWLDLVRYAESRGHEFDYDVPNAWHYRDYVIRAFNADVPYNQFVVEHIAGDLLEQPRMHPTEGYNESILGTGFWFLGEWVHSPVDVRKDEAERFDNMLDVMTKTFLGLTVACARCHDHKFDAIAQKDYYALQGFLQSSTYRQVCFETLEHNRRIAEQLSELRRKTSPQLLTAVLDAEQPLLERLPSYLLAARDAILLGPRWIGEPKVGRSATPSHRATSADFDPAYCSQIAEIANKHALHRETLAHVVVELIRAKSDAAHPLYAWALLAAEKDTEQPGRVAALLKPLLHAWREGAARADASLAKQKIIIDYATADPADFMQDGFAFGTGPLRVGEAILGDDSSRPIAEIATYGAVRRDKALGSLRFSTGTQQDAGRLGGQRSGQTFRTPTFTIETGQVYYLVKGAGRTYAVVDSHLLNQGPLHGEFANQWSDEAGGQPRWIAHNLRLYKGHQAHLEFSPQGDADLQVLMVVQGDAVPGNPLERPNALLLKELSRPEVTRSLGDVADIYGKLFGAAARRLRDHQGADAPRSPGERDEAALANWIVQRYARLASDDGKKKVDAAFRSFAAEQQRLVAQIRRESRTAPAMWDGPGEDERLFIRGNHKTLGEVVPRRFLEVFGGGRVQGSGFRVQGTGGRRQEAGGSVFGSGRLELARQMTDTARNPLITRVMVNRVWHHLFGRGIVESVDNFGALGKPPTHPELLDYLASQFARDGWSIKRLIRAIVLSSTYRMSSQDASSASGGRQPSDRQPPDVDPDNLLLHRMPIRRLEAEAIRDQILAVSGRLDRTQFGPPVGVYLTPFMQGRGRPAQSGPLDGAGRRSVYIAVRRNFLSPMMLAFDTPIPFTSMGRRHVSNVPAQALILMNDPFVVEQATVWSRRVLAEKNRAPEQRIEAMYLCAFSRPPSEQEVREALAFLKSQAKEHGLPRERMLDDPRVWADLAHVLMNVKEFLFVR